MPQALYRVENGPMVTTAAPVKVTTGMAIKTMLQLVPTSLPISVVEWGISFDGSALATPIECELVDTASAYATVTAFNVSTDVVALTDPGGNLPVLTASTTGSGYTSTAEGSITTTRELDHQLVLPLAQYLKQYPLGQEPKITPNAALRIRVTAAAAVNCYCYIVFTQG